ncbi:hypothetical protein E2C01_014507 [Portunus trituberculatus]|uniref:Uncharacterized protein n=1 Tax=Portunus trituberculatus TaxID=210409 RepID=A0A5B7DJD7_PORTR|nr:hypothetical protein [Portunus trituberculatus]
MSSTQYRSEYLCVASRDRVQGRQARAWWWQASGTRELWYLEAPVAGVGFRPPRVNTSLPPRHGSSYLLMTPPKMEVI